MAIYPTNANVQTNRNEGSRGRARPGERPAGNAFTGRPVSGVDVTPNAAQTSVITITASADGDTPALVIDGVSFDFTSSTTDDLTAAALEAVLTAALSGLLGQVVESVDVSADAVMIEFSDYEAHTVAFTPEGSTTATVVSSTPTKAINHSGGVFLAFSATPSGDPTVTSVCLPTTGLPTIGVVGAGPYPTHQQPPNPYGLQPGEDWPAGEIMPLLRDGPVCLKIMSNVSQGGPVYRNDEVGPYQGWACADARMTTGVSQVTRGDVEFNGTDQVGVEVDGYRVAVASTTSDDATATALKAAWDADAFAQTKAVATLDLSGTPSYFILTFLDTEEHIVKSYSPATADITGITNLVAAVAPTARATLEKGRFTETRTAVQGTCYADLG